MPADSTPPTASSKTGEAAAASAFFEASEGRPQSSSHGGRGGRGDAREAPRAPAGPSAVRRSAWLTFADNQIGLVLQLIGTMIVARILTPQEVGVFAIAAVLSTLASMVRDFGVAEYMIQERELTRAKIAAALALNIMVSWAMAALMFFGAPWVADFYGYPGVREVMVVQALGFVLVPFGAVTLAWFRRELDLRPVMLCNVAAHVATFGCSVALVLAGWGAVGLAWANVLAIAITVALSLAYRPAWLPRWPSLAGVGEVFHFSKFVCLLYLVSQGVRELPKMVIGRAIDAVALAMFTRANGLVEMFHRLLVRTVMMVGLPYLATTDRDHGAIAGTYARGAGYLTAAGWPFLAFLCLAADPVIRIIYGPQWGDAVPVARVLCLAGAIELVHCLSREALLSRGLVKQANALQIWLAFLVLVGALAGVPFGLEGIAWGLVAASAAGLVVSQLFLRRLIGLDLADMGRACMPSVALTAMSLVPAVAWGWWHGIGQHNFVSFAVGGTLLTAAAWLAAVYLLRHPLAQELRGWRLRLGAPTR